MREDAFVHAREDVYVSPAQIRRCELRAGDVLSGPVRPPLGPLSAELMRETERALTLARKVLAEPEAPNAATRQAG